jgi:hypothetical protein
MYEVNGAEKPSCVAEFVSRLQTLDHRSRS